MSKKLGKKMRMSNEEFCETGQVRIKLKMKKVRMSYERGQVEKSSILFVWVGPAL